MAEGGDAAPKRGDDFDYDALMERVDATIAESQGERARVGALRAAEAWEPGSRASRPAVRPSQTIGSQ